MSDTTAMVDFRQNSFTAPKRLVEECHVVTVRAVQQRFGKPALLRAIREGEPLHIPVPNGPGFDVWLTAVMMPMVGHRGWWFERIYFSCPVCCRPAVKLFYFSLPVSEQISDPRCRHCHNLSYLSVNCAGNKWYKEIVVPVRRLLKKRQKLRSSLGRGSRARLREVEKELQRLTGMMLVPRIRGTQPRIKRTYRDVRFID